MADNIDVDPGTGASKVPVRTVDHGGIETQIVKLDVGGSASEVLPVGSTARGLPVDPRLKVVRLSQTPTISASAVYAAKDAVGGLLTFADAVRAAGGTGVILSAVVVDRDQERAALDLVLFRAAITAPTDNAVFDPTDAELDDCLGVIPIYTGDYADFNDNAVATKPAVGLPIECSGTSLYGALVARGTPTYTATDDIRVRLLVAQD